MPGAEIDVNLDCVAMMSWGFALMVVLAVLAAVGILIEVPRIRTYHINLPKERERREAAARRTLAIAIAWTAAGGLAAAALLYAVWRAAGSSG